jgi:hypothetical protein
MYNCIIWIGEPSYGWAKPNYVVNWHKELKVKVNGAECVAPHCEFQQSMLIVNARDAVGGACRRQDVLVELQIAPESEAVENYKCMTQNNGQDCEVDPSSLPKALWSESWEPPMCEWFELCNSDTEDCGSPEWEGKPAEQKRKCAKQVSWEGRGTPEWKGYNGRDKIGAYVSYVIAF